MANDEGDLSLEDFRKKLADPEGNADLLLKLLGQPIESRLAREQIQSFLLGTLLTRGIRKGEAAAVVERDGTDYRVQLLLRAADGAVPLKTVRVPLQGYGEQAFDYAMAREGITEFDDPSIFIVTTRHYDSTRN